MSSMFLCMSPQSKESCDIQQSKPIGLQLESVEAGALVSFYLQSAFSMPVADIGRDTSISVWDSHETILPGWFGLLLGTKTEPVCESCAPFMACLMRSTWATSLDSTFKNANL